MGKPQASKPAAKPAAKPAGKPAGKPAAKPAPARPPHRRVELRLLDVNGAPIANTTLSVDWGVEKGVPYKTDASGLVAISVPMTPDDGVLTVDVWASPPAGSNQFKIVLHAYGAADTIPGAVARLNNLGLLSVSGAAPGALASVASDRTLAAIAGFEVANGIKPGGAPTGSFIATATRYRLHDAHDTAAGKLSTP